jgi:mannan endo-1,4-beta-mannosidase
VTSSALGSLASAVAIVAARSRRTRLVPRLAFGAGLTVVCLGVVAIPVHAAPARDATGVYLPNAEWNPSVIDQYASSVGREPAIVSIYSGWSTPLLRLPALEAISARGAIPMITWEPWRNWSEGVSLQSIASGAEDAYIAAVAREAVAWGGPIFLRFAHEMNGGWYPWGRVPGNTPAAYRAAWRHVVGVFRQEGARNVRWVWTPYVEGEHQRPFRRYYPGDKWVDWAGMDGFNWGSKFVSFAKLFQRTYTTMVRMTRKPLIVAETGSVEYGGSKPEWIRRALDRALPRYTHIRALVWWDGVLVAKGADVRLDTSPESFAAWSDALQAPRLDAEREFLLARPAWLRKR